MRLQNKFLGLLLPAAALAAAAILALTHRSVDAVIVGGLERSASMILRSMSIDAASDLAGLDEQRLLPLLQTVQRRSGASYASALAADGTIVAHTNVAEKGRKDLDPVVAAALLSDEPVAERGSDRGEPAIVAAVSVWSARRDAGGESFLMSGDPRAGPRRRLGALKIAVPLGPAMETRSRILRDVSLIVAAISGVAFALIVLLIRGVLKPIRGLTAGIARVGGGRYDVVVPVLSRDELGDLAESFNKMSGELARTTVSKEYVEGILENMMDLLVVTDAEGRVRTVNRAAASAFGREAGELAGLSLPDLFTAPAGALRPLDLEAAVSSGRLRDAEGSLKTKDGSRVPALLSASVLRARDGSPAGFIVVAKDITELKRAEEGLLAAKSAAEASSKELEAFSYSVAHDLRAPLRAVDGFSQVLLETYSDRLDDRGRDFLSRVRAGARKMGQLIDDLLNLSRITRSALRVETVDLSRMATDIAAELKRTQPARAAEFKIAPGLLAQGDPNLLRVALVNLLGNSWKYTGKHASALIEFGAERRDGTLIYFVRDDGAGFDMAFSKRLFQPFTRLHGASEFEGTGIGLATVQRVVQRHEGEIWGEAAVEKGATFHFTLWGKKP